MTTARETYRHTAALDAARNILVRVSTADLVRPTPCAGWDLRTLIEHMIGQNAGFATAIAEGDADSAAYAPSVVADVGVLPTAWDESVGRLLAAVESAEPSRPVRLVEIGTDVRFPTSAVVGMHLLDTVVHSWDLATALGERYRPDKDLLDLVAAGSRRIPDGDIRNRPGAAFARAVEVNTTDPWAATLARLGRAPASRTWPDYSPSTTSR